MPSSPSNKRICRSYTIFNVIGLQKIVGFDWDDGNLLKNEKHAVSPQETEQVFFNRPIVLLEDAKHSDGIEDRYHALGITDESRLLHVTFTLREDGRLLRPISARTMSRKERLIYAKAAKADSQI